MSQLTYGTYYYFKSNENNRYLSWWGYYDAGAVSIKYYAGYTGEPWQFKLIPVPNSGKKEGDAVQNGDQVMIFSPNRIGMVFVLQSLREPLQSQEWLRVSTYAGFGLAVAFQIHALPSGPIMENDPFYFSQGEAVWVPDTSWTDYLTLQKTSNRAYFKFQDISRTTSATHENVEKEEMVTTGGQTDHVSPPSIRDRGPDSNKAE